MMDDLLRSRDGEDMVNIHNNVSEPETQLEPYYSPLRLTARGPEQSRKLAGSDYSSAGTCRKREDDFQVTDTGADKVGGRARKTFRHT